MDYNQVHLIRWEEIPDFPLYIDQVVGIIEKSLSPLYIGEEKIITNTMINNYVKSSIVEAPYKKRYTRVHVAIFMVICILKNMYSLEEISKLIKITFDHLPADEAYNTFCKTFEAYLQDIDYQIDWHITDEETKTLFTSVMISVVNKINVQRVLVDKEPLIFNKKKKK